MNTIDYNFELYCFKQELLKFKREHVYRYFDIIISKSFLKSENQIYTIHLDDRIIYEYDKNEELFYFLDSKIWEECNIGSRGIVLNKIIIEVIQKRFGLTINALSFYFL